MPIIQRNERKTGKVLQRKKLKGEKRQRKKESLLILKMEMMKDQRKIQTPQFCIVYWKHSKNIWLSMGQMTFLSEKTWSTFYPNTHWGKQNLQILLWIKVWSTKKDKVRIKIDAYQQKVIIQIQIKRRKTGSQ